jgi:transposase-like protein
MKAMARQRSHSIEFKRQVAQEFVAGETLYALAKRYDISRNLIRVWVKKLETGKRGRHGPTDFFYRHLPTVPMGHRGQAAVLARM